MAAAGKAVLVIGNKNYSSWSMRPYMALAMGGIPFDLGWESLELYRTQVMPRLAAS